MIVAGSAIFLVLVYFLFISTRKELPAVIFFPALFLKLLSGLGVGLIYYYHYRAGDTIQYDLAANLVLDHLYPSVSGWSGFIFLSDLSFLNEPFPHVLQEARSLFFVKILTVVYLVTDRSYWLSSLFFSLAGFAGGCYLVSMIVRYRPNLRTGAVIAFLFFPSVVFWSSGILKESIAFAVLTGIAAILIRISHQRVRAWLWIAGASLLWLVLWKVKYHYAAVLLFSMSIIFLARFSLSRFSARYGWPVLVLLTTAVTILISLLHPNFRIGSVIGILAENQAAIIHASGPDGHVNFISLGSGWIHFIINIPVSLFAGLFMPLPWQGAGILSKVAGIFNLLVLVIVLKRLISGRIRPVEWKVWHWGIVIYVVVLAVVTAYSTPNFGTLERYKTGYLPFFLLWVFREKRLFKFLKFKFW